MKTHLNNLAIVPPPRLNFKLVLILNLCSERRQDYFKFGKYLKADLLQ
jgi:hypothetical protein